MNDSKMNAVNIGINLSTVLISACLNIMAIMGALLIFFLEKKDFTDSFVYCFAISILLLIVSIYFGGKGISIAREEGFNDNWCLVSSKKYFNKQAIGILLALIVFATSFLFIKSNNEKMSDKKTDSSVLSKDSITNSRIDKQNILIQNLEKEIEEIKKSKVPLTDNSKIIKR